MKKKQFVKFVPGIRMVVSLKTAFRDAWRHDYDASYIDGHLMLSIPKGKAIKLEPTLADVLGFDHEYVWGEHAVAPHARDELYNARNIWGKYIHFCSMEEETQHVPVRFYADLRELQAQLPFADPGMRVTPSPSLREKLDYGPRQQPLFQIECRQVMRKRALEDRTLRRIARSGHHSYRHVLYKTLQPTRELTHLQLRLRTWSNEEITLTDSLYKPINLTLHLHYV